MASVSAACAWVGKRVPVALVGTGFLSVNFDVVSRSLIAFTVWFILAKLMGKKQISQLTIFDYAVGITIGSIAGAFSIDNRISYFNGITSIIIWGSLPIVLSYIGLKSMVARRIFEGVPTILVQNGKILESNLRKERFNVNDLLEELRIKGVYNVSDVEFAVLETNGEVSVQFKSQKQPLTPAHLHITTKYDGLAASLIIDGKIMKDNLRLVNLDENWLVMELKKRNIDSMDKILLASLSTDGSLYIDLKGEKPQEQKVLE